MNNLFYSLCSGTSFKNNGGKASRPGTAAAPVAQHAPKKKARRVALDFFGSDQHGGGGGTEATTPLTATSRKRSRGASEAGPAAAADVSASSQPGKKTKKAKKSKGASSGRNGQDETHQAPAPMFKQRPDRTEDDDSVVADARGGDAQSGQVADEEMRCRTKLQHGAHARTHTHRQ